MRSLRRLFRNESGSSTVEFVLWVPLFAGLLMMTVDASFLYMNLTRMENAARDGVRRVATGQYDQDSIVPVVMSSLPGGDVTVDASCSTTDYACVSVSRPAVGMMAFGFFSPLLSETFGTEIRMRKEPGVSLLGPDLPPRERTA